MGWVFVALLVDLIVIKVVLEKIVHFDNWSEFDFDGGLLLSDLVKSVHDVTEGINILGWLLDLQLDVLDLFSKLVHVSLSFLKEILGIGIFPEDDPLVETGLNVVSLQAQGTNLMMDHDGSNFVFTLGEVKKLGLKVFELRIGGVEMSKLLVNLLLPEPVEFLKALQEFVDVVLSSLD